MVTFNNKTKVVVLKLRDVFEASIISYRCRVRLLVGSDTFFTMDRNVEGIGHL